MNTIMRKSILGIAGLAFTGGVFAGPVAAHADSGPVAGKAAAVQADKPDMGKLIPHGVQGAQSKITLNDEQVGNAKAIIAATKKAGLPERAAVISIATSLQESKLENLGHWVTPTTMTRWACSSSARPVVGVRRSRSPTRSTRRWRSRRASSRSTAGRTCR